MEFWEVEEPLLVSAFVVGSDKEVIEKFLKTVNT